MSQADLKPTLPTPAPRQWLTARNMLVGLGVLIAVFLILGSVTQSPESDTGFTMGLQRLPFLALAVLAFAAGLLSFVSPCTLPVLTAYFAFAFRSGRSQIAANTLAFLFGLGTTFSILGAVAFTLGRLLLTNQQLLLIFGGALVVGFGVMSLLGQGFSGFQSATTTQARDASVGGSFLFGLTFAVGWSSCVGPILGFMLTQAAASTSSAWQAMMLLFIYTLGLGLPLLLVSTFFGRMSRQSLFWRALKGKGWEWDTSIVVVALVWALALWRILLAVAQYAVRRFDFLAGQQITAAHSVVILAVVVLGAVLWALTTPGDRRTTVHLHTTQLISGALFITMGILMLEGRLSLFNSLISPEFATWLAVQEEQLIEWVMRLFG